MGFLYSQLFVTPPYPEQSFDSQTVIVTGSNVGLGKEAARHIARLGAKRIILAVRNLEAGKAAREDIIGTTTTTTNNNKHHPIIEVWKLDLSSYDSVKAFAAKANAELDRLDVLLENAGISTTNRSLAEGHERTITVNVISTFLLAFLLLPKLSASARDAKIKPRLTIVSSEVHAWTKFPEQSSTQIFDTLSAAHNAPAMMKERYMTSKLLEILVVRQIAARVKDAGVVVNLVNPGLCHSELTRDLHWFMAVLKFLLARSTEVGSRNLVAGAAAGDESHGQYMTDSHPADSALSSFVRSARGNEVGRKVWEELREILETIESGVTAGF